jgi:hypothetical protein
VGRDAAQVTAQAAVRQRAEGGAAAEQERVAAEKAGVRVGGQEERRQGERRLAVGRLHGAGDGDVLGRPAGGARRLREVRHPGGPSHAVDVREGRLPVLPPERFVLAERDPVLVVRDGADAAEVVVAAEAGVASGADQLQEGAALQLGGVGAVEEPHPPAGVPLERGVGDHPPWVGPDEPFGEAGHAAPPFGCAFRNSLCRRP